MVTSEDNSFGRELQALINKHSKENGSNTPDFILANYLKRCLNAFGVAVKERDDWYNYAEEPEGKWKKIQEKE